MMTQATTALSIVVPGGAAVGIATSYAMLRRAGFAPSDVARSVTLVSLWNQLANLAYPILALFLLTMTGEETAVLATVAFVGVAILGVVVGALVLVLYSSRMAGEIGDLAARASTGVKGRFHREPVTWDGRSFERFRVNVVDVLKQRWHLLTLATLAGSLTVFVVLLVSLRAVRLRADRREWHSPPLAGSRSARPHPLCGTPDRAGGPGAGPGPGRSRPGQVVAAGGRGRAWASPAWSTSSCTPTARRAGAVLRAPRCRTARLRRTSPSSTC